MNIEEQFESLRLDAIAVDESEFGDCGLLEPSLRAILGLVEGHPESREFFVHQFSRMAAGELKAPIELLPFCMRELKFPEVVEAAQAHYARLWEQQRHARYMNFLHHLKKAYEDLDEAASRQG